MAACQSGAADANAVLIAPAVAERSMDAAACIGCGACVAACPNASAMLFVAAKVAHLERLPQGKVEERPVDAADTAASAAPLGEEG